MSSSVIALGFDLVFIDIVVSPYNLDNSPLEKLPQLGDHIPSTNIKILPGGNGFNVAKIMALNLPNVFFVNKINSLIGSLMKTEAPNLKILNLKASEPNYTVALQVKNGEIQMNSVNQFLGENELTANAFILLGLSKIIPFSNIGLNKKGIKLFEKMINYLEELQVLFNEIKDSSTIKENLLNVLNKFTANRSLVLNENLFSKLLIQIENEKLRIQLLSEKIYYFDPSTLANFTNWTWLNQFLNEKLARLPGTKIISVNEHEFELMEQHGVSFKELSKNKDYYCIQHDIDKVQIWNSHNDSKNVPNIVKVPEVKPIFIKTTVGAGDAFNAGLMLKFLKTRDISVSVKHAIGIAQDFISGNLLPY